MKNLLLVSLTLFSFLIARSQESDWKPVQEAQLRNDLFRERYRPGSFRLYQLESRAMNTRLQAAPSEKNQAAATSATVIAVPLPDGRFERFRIVEAPVMDPGLAARYPGINAYAGSSLDHPGSTIRVSMGMGRFDAMIFSPDRPTIYLSEVDESTRTLMVYSRDGLVDYKREFACLTPGGTAPVPGLPDGLQQRNADDGRLRTYRIALACTGEFSQFWLNGSETTDAERKAKVLVAVNAALTRVNGIFEKDFGVRLLLIPNNDIIIYLNAASDPWTNNFNSVTQQVIDTNIGDANYDVGHCLHRAADNGNAGCIGCVCRSGQKGSAFTAYSNLNNFDPFAVDYFAHELGHQFGANHTFSFSNENTGAQMEPGSGSTVMGYAGITGSTTDVQPNSDDYFHAISIQQITNYIKSPTGGAACTVAPLTGNNPPTANAGPDYTIPRSTPFILTGSGSDPNAGDVLTYCWEQMDSRATGFSTVPSTTATAGPQFRSFKPGPSPVRIIPQLSTILSGANGQRWEALPAVSRVLNFRLTVRDNHPAGGNNQSDDMIVTVTNAAGPFLITSHNSTGVSWNAGSSQTITWDVANTTAAPVSCANVTIELSTDGGQTFPIVLAASTPNDGSETITVPSQATTLARVRVRAVGNIFFDINNTNISITIPDPGFDFTTPGPANVTCGTATTATISLGTVSLLGYNTPINLSATGAPAGTTVQFSVNPVTPGDPVAVTLTNVNTLAPGTYPINIQGNSGILIRNRVINFVVQPGIAPVITLQPLTQTVCDGSSVTFTTAATGATSFQWQVSTNGGTSYTNIDNATGVSYSIASATTTQSTHRFRCVITGPCNTSTTTAAVLTVNALPALTAQPQPAAICAGSNTQFSVTATGTGISYQWQLSTDGGNNFNNITNATAATLDVNGAAVAQNNHRYRCVVSGACTPPAVSNAAVLTVVAPPTIAAQPSNVTLCASGTQSVTFNVTGTGTGTLYQWQVSTNGGTSYSNIANANGTSLTVNEVSVLLNNNRYRVLLSNSTCTTPVVSNAALLTANPLPIVSLTASPFTKIFPGLTTRLTANVTPASGVLLTWERNGNPINVPGSSLDVNVDLLGTYRFTADAGFGCVTVSNFVTISDSSTNRIFFYPNPNQGQFQVRYNNPVNPGTVSSIRVFDSKGARVLERRFNLVRPYDQMWIDLRARGTGLYIVELNDASGKRLAVGRVVVN